MKLNQLLVLLMLSGINFGQAQTIKTMKNENPLLCDPIEGVCGVPDSSNAKEIALKTKKKPIKVIYFTDPICSSCWGIEPQLRKLKLEYGAEMEIEYRMGGLLPDWSYNSGGISKPSDVAHHWDEVSQYYEMPIDGDIWLLDPLDSSYPPSIAFKAAQLQNKDKAVLFLRAIREMVFLKKMNITKWENLAIAGKQVGLDVAKLKMDYENVAKSKFQEDLAYARELGVRGFPTLFLGNERGQSTTIYGFKPYATFEQAIQQLSPSAKKRNYSKDWKSLFLSYNSLTLKEYSELTGSSKDASEKLLDELEGKGMLKKLTTKNGSIWMLNELK